MDGKLLALNSPDGSAIGHHDLMTGQLVRPIVRRREGFQSVRFHPGEWADPPHSYSEYGRCGLDQVDMVDWSRSRCAVPGRRPYRRDPIRGMPSAERAAIESRCGELGYVPRCFDTPAVQTPPTSW